MNDFGKSPELVGLSLMYDNKKEQLMLSEAESISPALKKFNMENCKPASTPIDKIATAQLKDSWEAIATVAYCEAVGLLLY